MSNIINMITPFDTNKEILYFHPYNNNVQYQVGTMGKTKLVCPLCNKTRLRWGRTFEPGFNYLEANELLFCPKCLKGTNSQWVNPPTKKAVAELLQNKPLDRMIKRYTFDE